MEGMKRGNGTNKQSEEGEEGHQNFEEGRNLSPEGTDATHSAKVERTVERDKGLHGRTCEGNTSSPTHLPAVCEKAVAGERKRGGGILREEHKGRQKSTEKRSPRAPISPPTDKNRVHE